MSNECKGCGVVSINYGGIVTPTTATPAGSSGTTIKSLSLNGTVLTLDTSDGSKTVDLASMLPTITTDLFLKDVQRVADKIVYTVGEQGTTTNDTTFEIDISDLGGLSNLEVSLSGTVLTIGGKTIDLQPILPTTGTDLSTIPEKEFVTGSKVIAFDPSGNLYKFGQQSDYYKDVAVSLHTTGSEIQPSGETKHTVEITVTNTRGQDVPLATVLMYSGNTIAEFNLISSGATGVEHTNNKVVITGLSAYATVRYSVSVISSYNDYLSATVTVDGDVVSTNNSATVNLSRKEKPAQQQNVYTKECPLITATSGGETLTQSKQRSDVVSLFSVGSYPLFINLVDKETLAGTTIQIPDATSVRVFTSNESYSASSRLNGLLFVREEEPNKYKSWEFLPENFVEASSDRYQFSGGVLTFSADDRQAIIYTRPAKADCMWQLYMMGTQYKVATITQRDSRIKVTGLSSDLYSYNVGNGKYGGDAFKDLPAVETVSNVETNKDNVRVISSYMDYWVAQDRAEHYTQDIEVDVSSKLTIRLPKGTAYEFSIDRANVLPEQQGNISTASSGKVKVLSTATETDNVYTDLVDILIV